MPRPHLTAGLGGSLGEAGRRAHPDRSHIWELLPLKEADAASSSLGPKTWPGPATLQAKQLTGRDAASLTCCRASCQVGLNPQLPLARTGQLTIPEPPAPRTQLPHGPRIPRQEPSSATVPEPPEPSPTPEKPLNQPHPPGADTRLRKATIRLPADSVCSQQARPYPGTSWPWPSLLAGQHSLRMPLTP